MNQILSTGNNRNNSRKNGQPLDMRKVIIIFSVLILVFAIIIVGAKIYGMIKENNDKDTPISVLNKPTIQISEADNVCSLIISYDEGLDKISYYWNEEDVTEKNMNGYTEPVSIQIIIPEGDYNVLYVKATGIDGSVNEMKQVFAVEDVQDPTKPKISWYFDKETRKIDIVAESSKGIKNVTYKWEDEEEKVIENTEQNKTKVNVTIDAKRGTNGITITATDLEGNTQTKNDIIQGIYAPKFKVQLVNNERLAIKVSHDMGFKKVVINVNGQELVYDETNPQYDPGITSIDTGIKVNPGTVTVKIIAYTLEQEDKEYTFEDSVQITE